MEPVAHIPGGFLLLARKLLDSDLMQGPPLHLKLWVWMLMRANFRDRGQLGRGQFVTSIHEMQTAMSYFIGYRKVIPSKGAIRSAYEALSRDSAITTRKSTRGMVITICNYDLYQNHENYEAPNKQHTGNTTTNTATAHDTEEWEELNSLSSGLEAQRRKDREGCLIHPDAGIQTPSLDKWGTAEDLELRSQKEPAPIHDVIDLLNRSAGKKFSSNTKESRAHIQARWREGYSLDDFKAVIINQVAEWGPNPKMNRFLRPQTLFGPKFESYLNASSGPSQRQDRRAYDPETTWIDEVAP
jgi:uncharacterized phage protein (TIGR02220 family)